MPSYEEILREIQNIESPFDLVRRKYIQHLSDITERNVIIYYSGWLQKPGIGIPGICDADAHGFMVASKGLDKERGLDLVLHTPGGELAATEAIVHYLKKRFQNDMRVIVPQIAMSAGTMIACAAHTIVMGKQSSLGPIDPQLNGLPTQGIIEEFDTAYKECKEDPQKLMVWQPILSKYPPTLIGNCYKAMEWSKSFVKEWLLDNMFKDDPHKEQIVKKIVDDLSDHSEHKTHGRHLSLRKCQEIGLNVYSMDEDNELQNAILSLHHASIITLGSTPSIKIIESKKGSSYISNISNPNR